MNSITENTYQVGMPYAIDHNGKKVDARDAEEHTPYECPFCHCLMFHRRSHKGVHSFVRYQGQVHMADPCKQIEKTGRYHSLAASDSPEQFVGYICQCSVTRATTINTTYEHSNNNSSTQPQQIIPELRAVRYTSLNQIAKLDFKHINPNDSIGDNYVFSDYIISYHWANSFFNCASPYNLGARILHLGLASYDSSKRIFVFAMHFGNNYSIRFALHASTQSTFNKIFEKLYIKELNPISNKIFYKRKEKQVLIAGSDWQFISETQCRGYACAAEKKYCTNCHGLYMATAVTPKQVFPIPMANQP